MEPPSSDAKALRDQKTAQVRAAHGFLMAADELRDLERRHHPAWQTGAGQRRSAGVLPVVCSMRRFLIVVRLHTFPPHSYGAATTHDADVLGDVSSR